MNKINFYLFSLSLKFIFINFLIITTIIIFINAIELSRIITNTNSDIYHFMYLSMLKIPTIILESSIFVIIVSLTFLLKNLVSNNEFISLRNTGLSILDIYKPIGFTILLVGVFLLLIINPISAKLELKFHQLTSKDLDNMYSIKFIDNGMWMKNITDNGNKNYITLNEIDLDKMIAKNIKILITGNKKDKIIISNSGSIDNKIFLLKNVTVLDIKKNKFTNYDNYKLKLNFTKKNITDSLSNYKFVPFYNYLSHTRNLKKFNLYSNAISLHYISEIFKPIFMLIIGLVVLGFAGKFKRNESFFKILFISILISFIIILIEEIIIAFTIKLNLSFILAYFMIFALPLLIGMYKVIQIEND